MNGVRPPRLTRTFDLAAPMVTTNPNVNPEVDYQPPPQDDPTAQAIAKILLTGAAVATTVAALSALLRGAGISRQAVQAAYGIANSGTRHVPNARPGKSGLSKSSASTRQVAQSDVYFRSAYILNASRRINASLRSGKSVRSAVGRESQFYRQHENARANRLRAATASQRASEQFGPLLGWYHNPLLNNEAECLAASGNNYYPAQGTVIGLPGAVHMNCGCYGGPPHENGQMVNDVLSQFRGTAPKKFKLKLVS